MLTDTDRALLHACRAKRYALTKAQVATKAVTRAPHPQHPKGMPTLPTPEPTRSECLAAWEAFKIGQAALLQAMYTEGQQATDITALHIIEAEIRGLKPAHKEPVWSQLNLYRDPGAGRAHFDAWLTAG